MKDLTSRNPHTDVPVDALAAAIARTFETRYPDAAQEFLGLFSYVVPEGVRSLVGVGSQFQVETAREGETIRIRLKARERVEREDRYPLEGGDLHEAMFRRTAAFVEEMRPLLTTELGLPGDTPLLGGWRCGTHPDHDAQTLVFTIPRLACQVNGEEIH